MYTETPYRCEDPFWCALTPPGTNPEVWKSLADELREWRVGYFDTETTEGYAPCVSAEEMLANASRYRLHENQTTSEEFTFGSKTSSATFTDEPVTYLCYEGRALECQYDPSNDSVGDVACLKALEYGSTPKWAQAEKVIGTSNTYGACVNETFETAKMYAVDYAGSPSFTSAEDCSKLCFNKYGAFLSAFSTTECNCYKGSFGETCTDSDVVDGTYELWKVTKIDENKKAKVFKDIIEGKDPTGANLFDGIWAIKDRAVAEEKEFFEDKYPHCLPSSDNVKKLIESQACKTADECTNTDFPHCHPTKGVCIDVEGADGVT